MFALPWSTRSASAANLDRLTASLLKFRAFGSAYVALLIVMLCAITSSAQTAHFSGPQGVNLGSVNVGATGTPTALTFTFDTAGTLGSTSVLTQGAPGLDFNDAGSDTCTSNTVYSSGQSCTINVSFSPRFAGTRYGAAVLKDMNGSVIAIGYVLGTGTGPQVSFLPSTESVIPGVAVSDPRGIAADSSGNLYVSDGNGVEKEAYSNGTYTQTTITTNVSGGTLIALDGGGNLYIADTYNMRVLKETPSPSGYSETVVDSGFGYPRGVAVDGSGNVFIPDGSSEVLMETPSAGGYTRSVAVGGLSGPQAIAVDGEGNLYIGEGSLVKETPTAGGYTSTALPVGVYTGVNAVVVDGTGNVYFTDSSTDNLYKETPTPSGYVESAIVTDLHDILGSWGLAADGTGNLYIAYLGGNSLIEADFAHPPTLNFAATTIGTTSPDSPLTVMAVNDGNAPLALEIPSAGNNPNIDSNFTLDSSNPADCPILTSESPSPAIIAPGAACQLLISFTPQVVPPMVGALTLTDNNLNASTPAYATQSVTLNGTNTTPNFTLSSSPSSLSVYQGQSASATITITPQAGFSVNANLSVSGLPSGVTAIFSLNPTRGTSTLTFTASSSAPPGTATVTVTGVFGSETQTAAISLQINATVDYYLTMSAAPASLYLTVGTSGSATITTTSHNGFNSAITVAMCSPPIEGATVTFNPSTIPAPGTGTSTMTIAVSPNGAVAYNGVIGAIPICLEAEGVGATQSMDFWLYAPLTPVITWPPPSPIAYGTPLSATQLDATANAPGTFSFSPAAGTVLSVGTHTLNATFTPTDTTDYTTATATVSLTVNQANPTLTWSTPSPIPYGTVLSANQLTATSSVPGTFVYSPAAGTILTAGTQTLSVTFTPTDTTDYTTATATVSLTVNQANPTLTWSTPSPIVSGTALSATQLNATASVPGSFVYSPPAGTVLSPGSQTLTTTFTPSDKTDYTTATATVQLTVNNPATMLSPAPGSTLTGSSATFTWTSGTGVSFYSFRLGSTGPGSANLYNSGNTTGLSATVTGLPTNALPIYARIYSWINGAWQTNDYTYTASGVPTPAALTSPTPGSALTGSSATFTWTTGISASFYSFHLGTTGPGSANLYNSGNTTALSATVNGLPTNALPIYARIYSWIDGAWQTNDYTYTASGVPTPAALTSPTPGSALTGSSATFTWTTGISASFYSFHLGTTGPGSANLYNSGNTTALSATVNGLPTNALPIYARLYSWINGAWQTNDYTYTASGVPTPAVLTTPTPGSTLSGSSVTFGWTAGTSVSMYSFHLGTTGPGSADLYNSGNTAALSATVNGLPTNGTTIYARIYSWINGAWQTNDYTYTAF